MHKKIDNQQLSKAWQAINGLSRIMNDLHIPYWWYTKLFFEANKIWTQIENWINLIKN